MGLDLAKVAEDKPRSAQHDEATRSGWVAVARALGELVQRPVLVLDKNLGIEFANERAALLLGTGSCRLEGRDFVEAFVTPQAAGHTATAVLTAAERTTTTLQIPVAADDGRLLSLMVDVHPVAGGLRCLVVSAHCEVTPCDASAPPPDVAFEVSIDPSSWGLVTRVFGRSQGLSTLKPGACCYESVGHGTPPSDCPVARWSESDGESRAVTSTCVPGHVLVATVRASAPGRVVVSGRLVTLGVLGALADARIDELAARGHLTKREREVLVELVKSGDSLDVIAERLGIRPTTVKFHEANLVEKLGADSRIDLFRLIF